MNLRKMAASLTEPVPTAVLEHGANPGLISHFTKHALLDIAEHAIADRKFDGAQAEKIAHHARRDSAAKNLPDEMRNRRECEEWIAKEHTDQPKRGGAGIIGNERQSPDPLEHLSEDLLPSRVIRQQRAMHTSASRDKERCPRIALGMSKGGRLPP